MITDALLQHYAGDEKADALTAGILNNMVQSEDTMTKMLADALLDIYNDPTPDNNFVIELKDLTSN